MWGVVSNAYVTLSFINSSLHRFIKLQNILNTYAVTVRLDHSRRHWTPFTSIMNSTDPALLQACDPLIMSGTTSILY
jgi:hypothetical protein